MKLKHVVFHHSADAWQEGGSGGHLMASEQAATKEELEKFAAKDSAVKSGLLQYEIKTWFTEMD